jgi:peptidylprolyl isomerase
MHSPQSLPALFQLRAGRSARRVLLPTFLTIAFLWLSSCLPTQPTLDESGTLETRDSVVGRGDAVPALDSITQILANVKASVRGGDVFAEQQNVRLVLGLNQVIDGLNQGMRGMRVGGRRIITIPPRLGYGVSVYPNAPQGVPANSTVIFDVTLTSFERYLRDDLQIGTGSDTVRFGQTVRVNYVGRLTNGFVFDRSTNPLSFTIGSNQVVRGFDLGPIGMRVGGRRRLTIPSEMAYGAAGSSPSIPANATLIFEIELVSAF